MKIKHVFFGFSFPSQHDILGKKEIRIWPKKCQKEGKKKPSKVDSIKRGIGKWTEGPPSFLNMAKRSCVRESAKMHKKMFGMISRANPIKTCSQLQALKFDSE